MSGWWFRWKWESVQSAVVVTVSGGCADAERRDLCCVSMGDLSTHDAVDVWIGELWVLLV